MRTERSLNIIVTDDVVLPSNSMNVEANNAQAKSNFMIILIVASAAAGLFLLFFVIAVLRCKRNRKVSY